MAMKTIGVSARMLMCIMALSMTTHAIAQSQPGVDDIGAANEACEDVAAAVLEACLNAEYAKQEHAIVARRAYQTWLADRLAEDGGARNLALALHLRHSALATPEAIERAAHPQHEADGRLSDWMGAARASVGHDGVAWALLASTAELKLMPHRDDLDPMLAWAEAEPDNLTPLLIRMRNDDDAEMIFAAMDARPRHAIYWDEVQALGLHAIERHPPKPEWRDRIPEFSNLRQASFGTGLASAVVLPSYQYLIAACKPPLVDVPDRRAQCGRLGLMLQDRSDTLIGRFIGNALLRFSADSDAAFVTAESTRNRLRWMLSRVQAHEGPAYDAAYQAALREGGPFDESTLIERALKAVGAAAEPPEDWVPDVVSPK